MLAIKANYQNGKIFLLDAMPENIKKASLTIVIEPDKNELSNMPIQVLSNDLMNSEYEFEAIGMQDFFKDNNDKNIDWEDCFGLK